MTISCKGYLALKVLQEEQLSISLDRKRKEKEP
jgi:hypothetical protein